MLGVALICEYDFLMKRRILLAVAVVVLLPTFALRASASHTLNADQKAVIEAWLRSHPAYRLATDADCGCDADIRTMRFDGYGGDWKPVPDYHPYIVNGDLNSDGISDFAVAVVNRSRKTRRFTILVFNGPFRSADIAPAFIEANVNLERTGFFYGPPRPKPNRLVIGEFESEGLILVPKGKTYRYKSQSSVGE